MILVYAYGFLSVFLMFLSLGEEWLNFYCYFRDCNYFVYILVLDIFLIVLVIVIWIWVVIILIRLVNYFYGE